MSLLTFTSEQMADLELKICVLVFLLFPIISNAYDNLALNRPPTFEPSQTATPGNDGNPATCINMPATAIGSARFFVELASVRRIKEVNITFPAGAVGNEGFFISISNTSTLFTGHICYRSKINVIPQTSATYPCIGSGRYLSVYNTQRSGTIDFDICEVAVTGCPNKRYGNDCSQTCTCPDECDFETGECLSHAPVCNIPGWWGDNCNEICGFCKDGAVCNNRTGACPADCSAGYRSSTCNIECGKCKTSPCNSVTGACDNTGCQTGYMGTGCFNTNNFYNNQQGSMINSWAGNVATGSISYNTALTDGDFTTSCAYQNAPFSNTVGSTSYQYTLATQRVLREIVLYFSTSASSLSNYAGFSISIFDGTNRRVCYTWNSTGVPVIMQTVPCLGLANSINITNERKSGVTYPAAWGANPGLAFCELAATGCPAGKYGTYCEKTCTCLICDYVTGACPSVDQNCKNRTYGVNCLEKCGNCKNDEACNVETGACPNGCTAGYHGTLCKDACLSRQYGENCLQTCSRFCKNNRVCDSLTGSCPEGCATGYQGSTCAQVCSFGTYGDGCSQTCGKCLNGASCDNVNGSCSGGCSPGYKDPPFCKNACENGTYGHGCVNNCSRNCQDTACNHISGNCTKRCIIGYQGDFCSAVCSRGTYGENCLQRCTSCNNMSCNHIDGTCTEMSTEENPSNVTGTVVTEKLKSDLTTDDLAMLICLVVGVITLIVAVVFIIIAARTHKRFKQEPEDYEEEDIIRKNSRDALPDLPNNGHVKASDHLVTVQGPFRSAPKPAPPVSDDGGLYFGVDDEPYKSEDYYNASVFACGIPIPVLKKHIKTDQKRIEDEFKELQKGAIHPCTLANKLENKPKNRYLTVLPYDHSIVQLTPLSGKPDTNYINGSYIDSTLEDKAYIATQGPMTSTIGDFWRMVWQTYCGKIVMLTNLKEKNKIKCAQYWPNKGSTLEFGLYKISVQAEKTHVTYVQRAIRLEDMVTSECRTIHHFHYTAWSDHGTPDHVQLVAFHHHVSSVSADFIGPMVVHCSAGIGRTGTFIALDALLKQAKLTNQVQVFNFIRHMRKDRMNMIQTGDQYLYVYHTIYEALNMKNTSIKRKNFPKEFFKLEDTSSSSEKRTTAEFKTLQEMRGVFTADSLNPKPKRKGIKDAASHGKIQTIKVPPYGESRGFQLVQSLMPTMDVDLWNYVMTTESAVVVSLDKQSSDVLGSFLPTSGETRVSDYMATSISSSAINENVNASCAMVEITNRNTEQSAEIMIIKTCISGKNSKMTASEMANLAVLIEHTEKASSLIGETIVLSSDGISGPGLLCVVSYAIQDAITEKAVNIFQTVRQFQIRNPKFIANQEDYDFCYKAVHEFLLTDNDYANVDKDQE
ncbi:uncharacterized protein LOC125670387 isoform X2 [Ostrea edulis]|uniref:uncharacterized protein LOC125670387 isoform X2 n=1 Tax=Ostrea edulis TaxID=37623 RepID=UPI0024AFC03C|nr:uncharacterized protein LOC125670387 isoform X2 [Ostrea edulis]